ncbi:hypothetical protein ACVINW_004174 [Bradyrhizobium sp. USDA 4461]
MQVTQTGSHRQGCAAGIEMHLAEQLIEGVFAGYASGDSLSPTAAELMISSS